MSERKRLSGPITVDQCSNQHRPEAKVVGIGFGGAPEPLHTGPRSASAAFDQTHQVMKQRRLLGFAKLLFRELAGTRKIALLKGRDYGGDGCLVMHAFVPKPDACN